MSTTILSRTIGTLDKKLVLSNSQWAASLDIGTSWTKLRMGLRWALTDSGGNLTSTPRFFIGLHSNPASGMTNGPLTATCSHFVGLYSVQATLTRSTSPLRYGVAIMSSVCKKIGSTITDGANFSTLIAITADPANVRNALLLEFNKTSGTQITMSEVGVDTTAGAGVDVSLATLKAALVEPTILNADDIIEVGIGTTGYDASTVSAFTVDEGTDGPLNSLCVAWDRSAALGGSDLEISEVLFAKLA